jgi:hypothetical protein
MTSSMELVSYVFSSLRVVIMDGKYRPVNNLILLSSAFYRRSHLMYGNNDILKLCHIAFNI